MLIYLATHFTQGFNRRPLTNKDFLDLDGTSLAPNAVGPARVLWFPNLSYLRLYSLIARLLICSYVFYFLYTSCIKLLSYLIGLMFFWS
jgi:hypothetical protein